MLIGRRGAEKIQWPADTLFQLLVLDCKRGVEADVVGGGADEEFVIAGFHDVLFFLCVPVAETVGGDLDGHFSFFAGLEVGARKGAEGELRLGHGGFHVAEVNLCDFIAFEFAGVFEREGDLDGFRFLELCAVELRFGVAEFGVAQAVAEGI